jgi:hypothetical protein
MSIEKIVISNCPVCNGTHSYDLEVERAYVIGYITMDKILENKAESPEYKQLTRIFFCPSNSQQFQAEISLPETANNRIEKVTIIGLSKGRKT